MLRNLWAILLVAVVCLPVAAAAQEVFGPELPAELEAQSEWERLATRAEEIAKRDDASRFALNRLRAELVTWRDVFLSRTEQNSGRIATVDAQLAALGPVPESGEEAVTIASRRAELTAQRQALAAPAVLADESYARANGLIGEFDVKIRQLQAEELTDRGPSPVNPTYLLSGVGALWDTLGKMTAETMAGISRQSETGALWANLPRALLYLVIAITLMVRGRSWISRLQEPLARRTGRFLPLWRFLLSFGLILVPVVGLIALTESLDTLAIFGLRGRDLIDAIPTAGAFVIGASWLSSQIFPASEAPGFLGHDSATRAAGRRASLALAWVLAVGTLVDAGSATIDMVTGARAALRLPVLVLVGLLLWRLGHAISRPPMDAGDASPATKGRMRGTVGRLCTLIAVVAPLLAVAGYGAAGRALLIPAVNSLALIGVVLLLQRIVYDLSVQHDAEVEKGAFALLPVMISFLLFLASMPIFALIWGARVDDLLEIWTRFREGFSIGESRISPTDFLTFAVVFALGYLLTRFIQGTLRKSVLPRTRLDLGGQNAIVAGFGYVGIILAAIIAITSAGIDLSNLAIVAGALSVGIGFGLQNIVSNFVSGIILLIERPVSEGEWIEVGGQMGYVRDISVRSTRIETFDRTDVIIPNADLVSGQVTNWTRGNLIGRVIVPVGVAYGSDLDRVTEILRGIAENHPMVLKTSPPSIVFQGFGADSLDFEIRAILRDVNYVLSTKSEMNYEIARQFAAEGIEIPFAQRDIWLRNPEMLKKDNS